jgi:predicted ATPase/DNA-binding winged helix-turn-helix (wHTH) protein
VTHAHRFGRFEVRSTERLLLVDGQPAAVGARAFDVLMALIDHRDRVVTKEELLDLVWPGLVVEENNLAVQVSALRRLLGAPSIATIPGRGYRFVAPLDAPQAPEPDTPAAAARDRRGSLPPMSTPLLGRDDDLAALTALVRVSPLVTLLGAGGIGKTTLALAASHALQDAHADGATWVDLSAVTDPALVPAAVAQAAGVPLSAGADPVPALVEAFKPLQRLLVLDNVEHLLPAVSRLVGALRESAPSVRLLLTSQAPLRAAGERQFRLGGLSAPLPGTPLAEALHHGAVAMFVDRAGAVDRSFVLTDANVEEVIHLCRALDGVALALALAAARLPLLRLHGVIQRLGERLQILRNTAEGAPARQQTLSAALDWSHDLLGPAERAALRRLSVFRGSFALDAVPAVVSDPGEQAWTAVETLGELVDRGLVEVDATGTVAPRYRVLDTVRDYAARKLAEAGEQATTRRRHAAAMAQRMDAAYEQYWAIADAPWLSDYAGDLDDVRAGLQAASDDDPQLALRLIGAASPLFLLLGHAPEARRLMARLDAAARAMVDPSPGLARYWLERSRLHWSVSQSAMREGALRAGELYRALGDRRGLYLALRCAAGSETLSAEKMAPARDEMASLEQADWPPRLRAQRLFADTAILQAAGRLPEARATLEALLAMATASGLDAVVCAAMAGLTHMHLSLGEAEFAERRARELVALPEARKGNFILQGLGSLAEALLAQGKREAAREALAQFIAASRSRDGEWFALYADLGAWLACCEARHEAAACLIGYADAACAAGGRRDARSGAARALAWSAVEAALPPDTLARLLEEGARMGIESLSALALAPPSALRRPAG